MTRQIGLLLRFVLVLSVGLTGACSSTQRLPASAQPLQLDRIPLTYNHRRARTTIAINQSQWNDLQAIFDPPAEDSLDERRRIRTAIARLEQIAGEQTPTFRDWRMDRMNPAGIGCMDCIDEAINTTTYLRLLQERGLLHWHEVMAKAFRGPFQLDTHYSGQIREIATGDLYVVDSWFLANGWPPYVQKTKDWLDRQPWPAMENPDTHDEDSLDTAQAYWPQTP